MFSLSDDTGRRVDVSGVSLPVSTLSQETSGSSAGFSGDPGRMTGDPSSSRPRLGVVPPDTPPRSSLPAGSGLVSVLSTGPLTPGASPDSSGTTGEVTWSEVEGRASGDPKGGMGWWEVVKAAGTPMSGTVVPAFLTTRSRCYLAQERVVGESGSELVGLISGSCRHGTLTTGEGRTPSQSHD